MNPVDSVIVSCHFLSNRVSTVREKVKEFFFFQGQGIVREF